MTTPIPYLYVRGLRQVDHTVFCVADGQKTYRDPITGREVPYSSGQQVKRSILDAMVETLGEDRSPVTFNFKLTKKQGSPPEFEPKEPWSACDPQYSDQLIGGWMRASTAGAPVKRRSPLSISALRPLHPTLAGLGRENITFDRSDHPGVHKVRVVDADGNEVSHDEFIEFLRSSNRNQPMRIWIPEDKVGPRATGLFVYDIAIDLRTLFSVSINELEPEITADTAVRLADEGWHKSSDGSRLVCPGERREKIIPALAHALVYWRVTSNQSRTYSPQTTSAIAICCNASRLTSAIRAELTEESDYRRAAAVLDADIEGVKLFVGLEAKAVVPDVTADRNALDDGAREIAGRLSAYDITACERSSPVPAVRRATQGFGIDACTFAPHPRKLRWFCREIEREPAFFAARSVNDRGTSQSIA